MTDEELKKLLKVCRANGVLSIKMEGIELQLSDSSPKSRAKNPQSPKEKYSDDDTLFWSSPAVGMGDQ